MPVTLQGVCPLLQVSDTPTTLAVSRAENGTEVMLDTAYDPDAERP